MTEVREVDPGCASTSFILEEKEEEQTSLPNETVMSKPGESEARMRAEETLHQAVSPNLKSLGRKEAIGAEVQALMENHNHAEDPILPLLDKGFKLMTDLLQQQLDDCKMAGIDLQEFAKEMKSRMGEKGEGLPFEGKDEALKNEVFQAYSALLEMSQYSADAMTFFTPLIHKVEDFQYNNPFIQVYEFEQANAFPVMGTSLLFLETKMHITILESLVKTSSTLLMPMGPIRSFFYNGALFTGTQKLLSHLEEKGNQDLLDFVMDTYLFSFYFGTSFSRELGTKHPDPEVDPLIHFSPYVVKHASLDQIRDYFDDRFGSIPQWEKAFEWVDLHCKAAEVLLPIDEEKAKGYLEKAEKEVADNIYTTIFTFNKMEWNETRDAALRRIDEVKTQMTTYLR